MNPKHDSLSRSRVFLAIVLALSFVRCSGDGSPMASSSEAGRSVEGAGQMIDLSGSWNWSNTEQLTLPDFVAAMFGIPIEGPITHVRCESSGTMVLTQNGTSFSGSMVRTAATCETNGGFDFVPGPDFSPPVLDVVDGSIQGRNIDFVAVGGPLFTPHHGVVSEVDSGVATGLKATGRTIVPGHPKSPVPLDPPPAGTSKTIGWVAERP